MLFESVSGFPLNEGLKPFIVDKNQFMRRVEYVVSKVFVIPHFSDKVFCHRLPKTFPPLHEVVVVSLLSRLVNSGWFVGYFLHLLFLSKFCIIETIKTIGEEL